MSVPGWVRRLPPQQIAPGPALDGVGIRFLQVAHQGNAARCREEGERVADLVAARPLTVADILIVAPYNAQVGEITRRVRERTSRNACVSTVDKFQGQEGAVVIFSMATSSPEDASRNAEFLYSRHRLNVAISRARALAVLICSPDPLRLRCRTPEQMRQPKRRFAEWSERTPRLYTVSKVPILPPAVRVAPTVASHLAALADLCAKYKVRRLALFGSGTSERFDAEKGSDLDFLVEFEPRSPRAHAEAYFGLMEDLQRTLGVPVDLVEAGASHNPYFQEAVRNTQVVLFEAA